MQYQTENVGVGFYYYPHPLADEPFAVQAIVYADECIAESQGELTQLIATKEELLTILETLEETNSRLSILSLATQYAAMIVKLTQQIHFFEKKKVQYEKELNGSG